MSPRNVGRMPPAYGGVEISMVNNSHTFRKLPSGKYTLDKPVSRDDIVRFAQHLVVYSFRKRTDTLTSPQKVRDYLSLHLASELNEQFWVLFLCNRHRVIAHERLFHGTIDSSAVCPRVIVQKTLQHNAAAAVLFAHNHPSGVAEPSDTDVRLTKKLIDALVLIDVRVLDHLIVGKGTITSLAERGLM